LDELFEVSDGTVGEGIDRQIRAEEEENNDSLATNVSVEKEFTQ